MIEKTTKEICLKFNPRNANEVWVLKKGLDEKHKALLDAMTSDSAVAIAIKKILDEHYNNLFSCPHAGAKKESGNDD